MLRESGLVYGCSPRCSSSSPGSSGGCWASPAAAERRRPGVPADGSTRAGQISAGVRRDEPRRGAATGRAVPLARPLLRQRRAPSHRRRARDGPGFRRRPGHRPRDDVTYATSVRLAQVRGSAADAVGSCRTATSGVEVMSAKRAVSGVLAAGLLVVPARAAAPARQRRPAALDPSSWPGGSTTSTTSTTVGHHAGADPHDHRRRYRRRGHADRQGVGVAPHRHRRRAGARPAGRPRSSTARTCRSSPRRPTCATSTPTATARTWPASSSATTPPPGTEGIAPDGELTSIKVGTANGAVDVSQVIAAIDWVVQHRNDDPANPIRVHQPVVRHRRHARVVATTRCSFAVEKAWQAGIVVVAAAGNDGNAAAALTNPATDQYVIAVGAAATKGTVARPTTPSPPFTNLSAGRPARRPARPRRSIVSLRDPGSNIDPAYPTARVGDDPVPRQRHLAGGRGRLRRGGPAAAGAAGATPTRSRMADQERAPTSPNGMPPPGSRSSTSTAHWPAAAPPRQPRALGGSRSAPATLDTARGAAGWSTTTSR